MTVCCILVGISASASSVDAHPGLFEDSILSYRPGVGRVERLERAQRQKVVYQENDYVFHHLTPTELRNLQGRGGYGGQSRLHEMIERFQEHREANKKKAHDQAMIQDDRSKSGRHRSHKR